MLITEKHRSKICQIYSIVYELCSSIMQVLLRLVIDLCHFSLIDCNRYFIVVLGLLVVNWNSQTTGTNSVLCICGYAMFYFTTVLGTTYEKELL